MRELFSRFVGPVIDKVQGIRCTSFGYQYGEIVGSLASVYFCGGDCVEEEGTHHSLTTIHFRLNHDAIYPNLNYS